MSEEAIRAVVHSLIRKNIGGAKGRRNLDPELDLRGDLAAHDLDVLQLIMDIEDEFDIDINDDEAEGVKKISDLERLALTKERHVMPRLPVSA